MPNPEELVWQLMLIMQVRSRFGKRTAPLFLVVDEAPRLKNRIDFEEVLAVARGAATGVCLACQDVAQLGDDATRSALLTSCDTFVVLPGSSSESAAHLSRRLGDRLIETRRSAGRAAPCSSRRFPPPVRCQPDRSWETAKSCIPPLGRHVCVAHARSVTRAPILTDLSL